MNIKVLSAGLDNMYADRLTDIFKIDIVTYSLCSDLVEIQFTLDEWQKKGFLKILKPLAECKDKEPYIKLLGWIQPHP
jgi:hypothetical protein